MGATRREEGFEKVRVFAARFAFAAEEARSERLLARFAASRRSRAPRVARVSAVLRLWMSDFTFPRQLVFFAYLAFFFLYPFEEPLAYVTFGVFPVDFA